MAGGSQLLAARSATHEKTLRPLVLALAAAAATCMVGCAAVGPNFHRPDASLDMPLGWSSAAMAANGSLDQAVVQAKADAESRVVTSPADVSRWWTMFHDPVLNALIEDAASQNIDVQAAALRIAAARAQYDAARGAELPQVAGSSVAGRTRMSENGIAGALSGGSSSGGTGDAAAPSSPSAPVTNLFQAGFDATWELDLWGKVRRNVEAAGAGIESAEEARHDALASLSAEIARSYFGLRSVERQLMITRADIATQQRLLDLTGSSKRHGLAPESEVAAQSAQLQSVLAQVPVLEQNLTQARNRVALLLALPPGALDDRLLSRPAVSPVVSPVVLPPQVPIGMPGDLLRRRPDIRRSEAELHAATARIGVATASLFPSIRLGLAAGLQSTALSDLSDWGSRFFLGGAAVSIPIFQGGQLRAQIKLADINAQQAALSYRSAVLGAFHEVDGALVSYGQEQRRTALLTRQLADAERSRDLAVGRWRSGLAAYLEVLDAQRTTHRSELQLVQSQAAEQTDLIALFKALGGGWPPDQATATTVSGITP